MVAKDGAGNSRETKGEQGTEKEERNYTIVRGVKVTDILRTMGYSLDRDGIKYGQLLIGQMCANSDGSCSYMVEYNLSKIDPAVRLADNLEPSIRLAEFLKENHIGFKQEGRKEALEHLTVEENRIFLVNY